MARLIPVMKLTSQQKRPPLDEASPLVRWLRLIFRRPRVLLDVARNLNSLGPADLWSHELNPTHVLPIGSVGLSHAMRLDSNISKQSWIEVNLPPSLYSSLAGKVCT
jgi:hypothetical protein